MSPPAKGVRTLSDSTQPFIEYKPIHLKLIGTLDNQPEDTKPTHLMALIKSWHCPIRFCCQ